MRCLSTWQPWACLVVEGIKTVETRSWPCPAKYLGTELVICSTVYPTLAQTGNWTAELAIACADLDRRAESYRFPFEDRLWPRGYALGTVRVVACVQTENIYPAEAADYETTGFTGEDEETGDGGWAWAEPAGELTGHVFATATERGLGNYEDGRYAWLLAKPRRFVEPVRVSGRQRIWSPSYPEQVQIQDQIEALRTAL